jgi:hypothetical protein
MANFLAELKRRHIYRVGAAYVVAAWALAQVIDLLSQVFALPSWIAQPAIIVIAVGFPIALLVTWVVESKPQQVIASAVRSKPTILDWMLFSAVAVLIALSGYRLIAPSSDMATRQTGVDAVRSAASSPAGAISIAVLPFANLSGDAQQEFFSDGMTEEITSALARVPDLRVVARTSAYQFRDQNRDIQSIGQQLHATHFIEGSASWPASSPSRRRLPPLSPGRCACHWVCSRANPWSATAPAICSPTTSISAAGRWCAPGPSPTRSSRWN